MAQIAEIIKYEGDNSTFIWKHPCEDFNSLTQLIVHESQEAIFFMNGQALDTFGAGRYTLETQNIPKLGKFLNRLTNGETPFHCEVYFINQTVQMALKWGTDSKVRYIDPEYGVPLELGASGELNLCVSDGRKLLIKLVGTMNGIAWGNEGINFTKSLQSAFRPLISTAVKSNLTSAIKAENINILEVDEHLDKLSEVLRAKMLPGFEEYGLTIPQFYLTTIVLPEDNPSFRRIRELHTISLQTRMAQAEAQVRTAQAIAEADVTAARRQIEMEKQTTQTEIAKREAERLRIESQAQAEAEVLKAQGEAEAAKAKGFAEAEIYKAQGLSEAEVMQLKGYSQKDLIEADVQKAYAEGLGNFGSHGGGSAGGGVASDMIGMMAGMKVAGTMMDKMDGMLSGLAGEKKEKAAASEKSIACANCGAAIPAGAKFCLECGEKVAPVVPDGMIVCPGCGKSVIKGKFCLECGYRFITVCPSCGMEIPTGAKFCLECGQKI